MIAKITIAFWRSLVLLSAFGTIVVAQSKDAPDDTVLSQVDQNLLNLKSIFDHDFRDREIAEDSFSLQRRDTMSLIPTPKGLKVVKPLSHLKQFTISPRFSLYGDFDIVASFEGLENMAGSRDSGVFLSVTTHDDQGQMVRIQRNRNLQKLQFVRGQLTVPANVARRVISESAISCESTSGHLRIARTGDRIHTLFAESDSTSFRTISTDTVSDREVMLDGIVIGITNGDGEQVGVILKKLQLRAERMMFHPIGEANAQRVLRCMNLDTGEVRDITSVVPPYSRMGSPKWSFDGKMIAYDTTNNSTVDAHIMVVNADGTEQRDLGLGCLPSFSPDGEYIVYSTPNLGVMLMNVDGTNPRVIDGSGWSGQWSPDGQWIAYTRGGNIVIYDVQTGGRRYLLSGDAALRYNLIYWNFGWSHDSKSIACKARLQSEDTEEVSIIDIDYPEDIEILSDGRGVVPDITWSPDNQRILFAMKPSSQTLTRLYSVERGKPGTPELWPNQPKDMQIFDIDWSEDGKLLLFVSEKISQPREWLGMESKN